MANCHSIPSQSNAESNKKGNKRTSSSNARLTSSKQAQHLALTIKDEQRQQQYKFPGLSTADILLFYIKSQVNYRLCEHEYYPNIVIYYNEFQQSNEQNPQTKEMKGTSELKQSSVLQENANANQYPYNCLGIITGKDLSQSKVQKVGTGCLIAPNLVLTSASLVIEASTGLPLQGLRFFPKARGNIDCPEIKSYQILNLRVPNKFLANLKSKEKDSGEDYALLLLNRPIKRERYIYIGYDMNKQNKVELYGYSLGLIQLKLQQKCYKQTGKSGKIVQIEKETFIHNIRAKKTFDGAPIIIQYSPGFIFTVGIHSAYSTPEHNSACRITASKVENLKEWTKELTYETFNITTVKMVNVEVRQSEQPKHFTPLISLIAQAQQLVDLERQNGDTDQLRFYLGKLGELCWKNGEFNRSIINLEEGLRLCNQLYKPQSLQSAFFHSNLGLNYDKLKQYQLAYRNFEIALRINRRKKGEQSQGVAIAYNNIGNIFKRKGRYEKALEYFNKSLKIKIKLGGQRSEGVAASISNIALLEWEKKNYIQAIKRYKQSLGIYRAIYGTSHFEISRTLYNLALCYYDISEYDLWLDRHFEGLCILEQLKMTQHPSYSKRKSVFMANLNEMINSPHVNSSLILKSIKMLPILFKYGEDKGLLDRLHKKIESFK